MKAVTLITRGSTYLPVIIEIITESNDAEFILDNLAMRQELKELKSETARTACDQASEYAKKNWL